MADNGAHDEVAASVTTPKRPRRSNRTINESSPTEAIGSRSRRQTTAKKDFDVIEGEAEAYNENKESRKDTTSAANDVMDEQMHDEPKKNVDVEPPAVPPKPAIGSTDVIDQEEPDGNDEHEAAAVVESEETVLKPESKTDDNEMVKQSTEIGIAIEEKQTTPEQPVTEESTKLLLRTREIIDKENIDADDNVLLSKAKTGTVDDSDRAKKLSTIDEDQIKSSELQSGADNSANGNNQNDSSESTIDLKVVEAKEKDEGGSDGNGSHQSQQLQTATEFTPEVAEQFVQQLKVKINSDSFAKVDCTLYSLIFWLIRF